MSGVSEEPPDSTEVPGPSESSQDPSAATGDICEGKSQLETFKDIMSKTRTDLKKKEEELQEYASKLSEIKSRSKRTRRSKDSLSSSVDTTSQSRRDDSLPDLEEDTVDDISQAKTPKAKSSLLQRKLAENRKRFEQRSKEMTESKRAVEEKVEAIRQQMDQTELTIAESQKDPILVAPVRPVLITSQIVSPTDVQVGLFPEKDDNKITELKNRILELEATVIDLQENLREKDSVIESKTKAVTLMSADLSKKGKSTLDTLEDTKDEMRTMQENFVLIETSLRGKNENLLEQLQERNDRVTDLEVTIGRYEQEMEEKRLAETASASLSRTTMDTLADTKDEMRAMQENFVLMETSLREKNDNLLRQLEERETKLAEAMDKIYKLEAGAGIAAAPEVPDLRYKIDKLERSNVALQDEKFELQKSIVELQAKIVSRESTNGNGLIIEKDNRIAELENLIEELKNSNQLLEEESKAELQKQVDELATRNDEFRTKIDDLERLNNDLETEKNALMAKLPDDSGVTKEDSMVEKLKKELEDLNKSMIKLKAQHKSKLRNLQKQLESFKAVSDANAELVKLGNQVALLEEEKGNLQLSLVDFDELKASAGDWQDRIADLESKVSAQANDIQAHVEAIAILENQKLDLMQDLHSAKQEISSLEAENAESENLRVTAEMKIVDMEEQLESFHRMHNESVTVLPADEDKSDDLLRKIEQLSQENSDLLQRIAKLEEKPSSETGSTESFETINEDRNELTKRIETLSARNVELEEKLSKVEQSSRSNVGSTESFETINDTDRNDLVKKIDLLSRENSDLVTRLNKFEEKGSSDTGSTESFEKIPEQVENSSRIEILTRENNELVIKLTKLEEKMDNLSARQIETPEPVTCDDSTKNEEKLRTIVRENNDLAIELTKLQEKLSRVIEDKVTLQEFVNEARQRDEILDETKSRVNSLIDENEDLHVKLAKLEESNVELRESFEKLGLTEATCQKDREDNIIARQASIVTVETLEAEIERCRELIGQQNELVDQLKTKLAASEIALEARIKEIDEYEATAMSVENLQRELKESTGIIDEWKYKCDVMEKNMETLELGKNAIEEGLRVLQEENKILTEETRKKDAIASSLKQELDETIGKFSTRFDEEREIAVKQEQEISSLQDLLRTKDRELHEKYTLLQNEMINIDSLQDELNEQRAQQQANETIIRALNEDIHSLRAEIIVREERTFAYDAEIASLREQLSTKAAKEARNEQIFEEMNNSMNEQAKENERLRNLVDSSNAEIEYFRARLTEKENEIATLHEVKNSLDDRVRDLSVAKEKALESLETVQRSLDDGARYADELKAELSDGYRMLELLKAKHTEDVEMLNRRLEDLIEALNEKTSERDSLSDELTAKTKIAEDLATRLSELSICQEQLAEKEILVGRNVTESMKIDLEHRVKELEEKLSESEANTQSQLQKRKILAANLKKKSSQYEELEARAAGTEARAAELETKVNELEARSAEFEAKASRFEIRVGELEAEIIELEAKVREFETNVAQLETRAASFEAKASELEIKALEFENEGKELTIKATEFESQAKELAIKAGEFEARATSSEAKVTELEAEASLYEARAVELETKVVELQSDVSVYEARRLELETRSAQLEEKIVGLNSEVSNYQAKMVEIESRNSELEAKVVELNSEVSNYEARALELGSRSVQLEEKVVELNTEVSNYEAKMLELGSRNSELEAKVVALNSEISNYEAKMLELGSRNSELEAKIVELNSEVSNYEAKMLELGSRNSELEAKVVELNSEVSNYEARALEIGSRSVELEAKNVELNSELSMYEARALELEAKAAKYETEAAASQTRASNLEATIREIEPKAISLEIKAAELEAKATEFEEKWLSEKSEKDAANLRLQENERTIRESSETIVRLENELASARNEASESFNRAEALSSELMNSAEKIAGLVSQVAEKFEETERLRAEFEQGTIELTNERRSKETLIVEFEAERQRLIDEFDIQRQSLIVEFDEQRQTLLDEKIQLQQILDETKENARELGVRMEVMESEYVEKLNTIQTLRTENGMLVSKQAQISERLENSEKEASELKIHLDRVQRENAEPCPEVPRREEASSLEVDDQSRNEDKQQPCDHCDQCQTVVQALEAKLQERDAEIENLDNELANSIGNFVHMRESLRVSDLMNQSTSRSRNLEEARETELAFQYSALTTRNAELSEQLTYKIRENEELNEKIVSLEALNAALRERTVAVEEELRGTRDANSANSDEQLREALERRDIELQSVRNELESMKARHEEWLEATRLQIEQLERYNDELTRTRDDLTSSREQAETEIASLKEQSALSQRKVLELQEELERHKADDSRLAENEFKVREPRAASSFFVEGDAPKLFDAEKLFGPSSVPADSNGQLAELRNALTGKDLENAALLQEIKRLGEQIVALESQAWETSAINSRELEISRNDCQRLEMELTQLRETLTERNRRIETLNLELNNVGAQLAEQYDQHESNEATVRSVEQLKLRNEECANVLKNAEDTIVRLKAENAKLAETLANVQDEKARSVETVDLVATILNVILGDSEDQLRASSQLENSPAIYSSLLAIKNYRDSTRNETNELLAASNRYENKIARLEEELKALNDSTRIQELEERVNRVTSERDINQLQVNDLTRSLEELQGSMENASARLRSLQGALDQSLADNDRLNLQLDALKREIETKEHVQTEKLQVCETMHVAQTEKLISCELAESRVVGSSGIEMVQESGWDEDALSWNPEDAQLAEGQDLIARDTLRLNLERRLNTRIAELEDTIRDLEAGREKLNEEMKLIQVRDGKLVRKLKEYKIQNESLQQQLKIQKATVEFCDLDTAIEEELKSQIDKLEKSLNEATEETRKAGLERENMTKRIDVLVAANERLVEMKERQDMEVEVLKIRTRELTNKLESMDWQLREACDAESCVETSSVATLSKEQPKVEEPEVSQNEAVTSKISCVCNKYKAEIEELRDEMEALAAENEQLQKLLEEQRATRLADESKLNERLSLNAREIEELSRSNDETSKELAEARNNYETLLNRCNRDADDSQSEIIAVKQSHDILKAEAAARAASFESEITRMRDEGNSAIAEIDRLGENMRALLVEKEELTLRTKSHEETVVRLASLEESMTELTELLNSRVQEVAELKREIQRLKADRKEALVTIEDQAQNYSRELSINNEATKRYVLDCETRLDEQSVVIGQLRESASSAELELSTCRVNAENLRQEIERLNVALLESKSHRESLQSELAGKEQDLFREEDEVRQYAAEVRRLNDALTHLQKSSADKLDESNRRLVELEETETSLKRTIHELTIRESEAVGQLYRDINEKDVQVANLQRAVLSLEEKHDSIACPVVREKPIETPEIGMDEVTSNEEIRHLRSTVDELRKELSRRNEQIEDYKYQLSESTYPSIIQALQDQVNTLYEEKTKVEESLNAALQDLSQSRENYQTRRLMSTAIDEHDDRSVRIDDETKRRLRDAEDEVQSLKTEIDERIERFQDLHDRYENAEIVINELRLQLATKDNEIALLRQRFEPATRDGELLRNVIRKDLPSDDVDNARTSESSSISQIAAEQVSNELDLALYMLHHRDVRCEELTHELMQLLEERDTLQLRLSNAIRINEELRRSLPIEAQTSDAIQEIDDVEPLVEKPSPSRSVGPVEIAKEAIDTPNEDKIALAQKLSQLHNTGHRRDVRLLDDRELRHNQQMSLLAHRDVLSTLPPEAAAKLVNANYTLSRDVQSQSSVLMNWLWGKSTPKVVHM